MDWQEREANTWLDFVAMAGDLTSFVPPPMLAYVFRGQPDMVWGLQPSLTRPLFVTDSAIRKFDYEGALKAERAILDEFQTHSTGRVPSGYFTNYEDLIGWWSLMQHYRAPTRLLDWTASPFVAAYFAVENPGHWNRDAAVWVVNAGMLNQGAGDGFSANEILRLTRIEDVSGQEEVPSICFIRRNRNTDRMIAQQGLFSLCRDPTINHAVALAARVSVAVEFRTRFRIIIRKELKPEFLWRLRGMNISPDALFPGIDGIGMSMHELVRLQLFGRPNGPLHNWAAT
jgi:FRG domain